jgi:hypothetical protein
MLPDVKNKILDGVMEVAGIQAIGIFAAVGVSAIPSIGNGVSAGILTLVDAGDVDRKIGDGLLRDLIVSAFSIAKTTVYAIALGGSRQRKCELMGGQGGLGPPAEGVPEAIGCRQGSLPLSTSY